jgi:hypothetical protein
VEANERAGSAKASAEVAAWSASRATAEADQAAVKAGSAGELALRVNDQAGVLEKRTADLQAKGESLQKLISTGRDDLAVLKMRRAVQNTTELIAALGHFKGTEYAFSEVFVDAESLSFMRLIDSLLQQAGWTRVPIPLDPKVAAITVHPFSDCPNCNVPIGVREGLTVLISLPNPPTPGETQYPSFDSPKYEQAAVALHDLLFLGVFPRDGTEGSTSVQAEKGDSHIVRIAVGSKPVPVEPYDPKEWHKIIEKVRQQKSQTGNP